MATLDRHERRERRHRHIRKRVYGTPERPRLAVYKSLRHLYAQLIDDLHGQTLVYVSTLDKSLRDQVQGPNREAAQAVGKLLAERAREKGIERVVFDRGGYPYHGVVKALAESAREGGLAF
jgi:large subunit ribosomal protein L18